MDFKTFGYTHQLSQTVAVIDQLQSGRQIDKTMEKNVGQTDRTIRIIIAVILLYFIDYSTGAAQLVLGILAAVLLVTALNGFCLIYKAFGLSTKKKKDY